MSRRARGRAGQATRTCPAAHRGSSRKAPRYALGPSPEYPSSLCSSRSRTRLRPQASTLPVFSRQVSCRQVPAPPERIARSGDVVAIANGGVYALKNVGESSGRMFVFNVPGRIHAAFFSSLGEPMPVGTSEFPAFRLTARHPAAHRRGQTIGRHNPSLKLQSRMWEDQSASRAKTSSGPLKVLVANFSCVQ